MLKLRPATAGDWARTFYWRNEDAARAASVNTAPVSLKEHMQWLEKTLAETSVGLYVFHDDSIGAAVGTGRLDIRSDGKKKYAELSLTVDPRLRGKGYSARMIALMVGEAPQNLPRRATVKSANAASLRAFAENAFVPVKYEGDLVVLERRA